MDTQVFQLINQFAGRWPLLDGLAIFLAQYSGYVLVGILLVVVLVNRKRWLRIFFWSFSAAIFSRFVITEIIRFLYHRPRPFEAFDVTQLLSHGTEASLPSGHAAFYFALSWFLFFINKKLGIAFLLASFLMGLSRIFVGIHYPGDILAGFGVGLLSAFGMYFFYKKWHSIS